MRHPILLLCCFSIFLSCNTSNKKAIPIVQETIVTKPIQKTPKASVGVIKQHVSRALTKSYFMNFKLNPQKLQQQGLPIHKYFAEYLGLALKLTKTSTSNEERKAIKEKAKDIYNFTLKPEYHNLNELDFKAFKKTTCRICESFFYYKN